MSRSRIAFIAVSALAMTGCTYGKQEVEQPPLAERDPSVRITGPAVSCIPIRQFNQTRVRDRRTVDFMKTSRTGWRNVLPQDCGGLMSDRAFTFSTALSQLCDVDIIRPLVSYGGEIQPQGACGLGKFVPIEIVRKK